MGKGKSAGKRFADKQIRKAQQAQAEEAARRKEAARRDARARKALKVALKPQAQPAPQAGPAPVVQPPSQPPTRTVLPQFLVCHFRAQTWVYECGGKYESDAEFCARCGRNLPGKFSTYRRHWYSLCGHRNGPDRGTCSAHTCREPAPWTCAPNTAPAPAKPKIPFEELLPDYKPDK